MADLTEQEQQQADELAARQAAERERVAKAAADEKARADKEAAERDQKNTATEQRRAAKAAKQDGKAAPAEGGPNSAERLRAFEDENFGKRAVRINGQIERGIGSPYAAMTDERKAQYAALEDLVAAERELNDATAAVGAAEAKRVAAEERLAACDKAAQERAAEADAEKAEAEKEAQDQQSKEKARAAG